MVVLLFGEKGNKSENSRWDFIFSFSSFFLFVLPAIFEIHSLAQSNKQTSNSSMGGNKGRGKGKARAIVEEEEEDMIEEKTTPSPQPSKIAAATKTKGKRTRHEIMSPSSPAHSNSKSQQSSDYAQLLQPIRFLFFSSFFFFFLF